MGRVASAKVLAVMPDDQLLRVRRRSGEPISGFVSSVGDRWALIHRCRDTTLDGYSAIRLRDLTDIVIDARSTVVSRALELKGHEFGWIPAGLDSTAAVLGWCATRFEILTVHPERRQPSTCHVGVVEWVDANGKRFRLREMSPMAQWWPDAFAWTFADVTRIDVGDAYANDLLAVNRADLQAS